MRENGDARVERVAPDEFQIDRIAIVLVETRPAPENERMDPDSNLVNETVVEQLTDEFATTVDNDGSLASRFSWDTASEDPA